MSYPPNSDNSTPRGGGPLLGTPTNVSEPAFEYLLSSMLHWVEEECEREHTKQEKALQDEKKENNPNGGDGDIPPNKKGENEEDEEDKNPTQRMVMIAENAAAKMERLGYDVGYRLVERLAQNKPMAPASSSQNKPTPAMIQLEAVKFICKEFWTEVFRKQIDKLQTNHRGVFVLRDLQFKWLKRLPGEVEVARVMAIKILAFPCGLIRGALANLGIVAVVSCDFLADGVNMSSCSFNVKVKS